MQNDVKHNRNFFAVTIVIYLSLCKANKYFSGCCIQLAIRRLCHSALPVPVTCLSSDIRIVFHISIRVTFARRRSNRMNHSFTAIAALLITCYRSVNC